MKIDKRDDLVKYSKLLNQYGKSIPEICNRPSLEQHVEFGFCHALANEKIKKEHENILCILCSIALDRKKSIEASKSSKKIKFKSYDQK